MNSSINFQSISYSFTHQGQRVRNEDFYIADDINQIYILTDGMGGYAGGEVASRIVADSCYDYIKSHRDGEAGTDDLLEFIRSRLKAVVQIYPQYASMGATLSCLYIHEGYINAVHIGDSKIIILADQIYESRDHTYSQHLIDQGLLRADEYQGHPMRHILTRCLTAHATEKFKADYNKIPLKNGWITFFLCTDGVLETFSTTETIQLLTDEPDIHKILIALEQNTLKYSKDNSTAIIVGFNYSVSGN